jgi:Fur family ferric uptake transcriptional regulator
MPSLTRKEPYTMPKTYHTKATQEIEQYLSLQKDKSFCVADVYHYLESNNVDVNQSTVYRTLDRMTDNGVLVRFKTASSGNYYYRISDEHNNCDAHLHMQCRKCGKVMHLDCAFMDEIRKNLMKQYGFTLECNGSTLSGLCRNCKEEQGGVKIICRISILI